MKFSEFLNEKSNSTVAQKYKVRFHLGEGENKFKWRVENITTKDVKFYDPMKFDLVLVEAKLHNQKAGANKIYTNETTKAVVSWIMAEKVFVLKAKDISRSVLGKRVAYNPNVFPHWQRAADEDEIKNGKTKVTPDTDTRGNTVKNAGELIVDVDKTSYTRLVTDERAVFILKDGSLEDLTADIEKSEEKELHEKYDIESFI